MEEPEPSNVLKNDLRSIPGLSFEVGVRLAPHTTLQIGGPARLLVTVSTEPALVSLVRLSRSRGFSLHLFGMGSNVLIPDEGLRGVVFRLDGDFKRIRVHGESVLAGAAVPLGQLARKMSACGLLGLEPLSGFPSTVGGAVFMNAGCYGTEISDLLEVASIVDRRGNSLRLRAADLEPAYRSTNLQSSSSIVVAALLRLTAGDAEAALLRLVDFGRRRRASMPSLPNAGSVFRNPEGDYAGRLIDLAGLRGVAIGGAQISEEHANVIVNQGGAAASDVIELMLLMHRRVFERFGVALDTEVVLTGNLRSEWRRRSAPRRS